MEIKEIESVNLNAKWLVVPKLFKALRSILSQKLIREHKQQKMRVKMRWTDSRIRR